MIIRQLLILFLLLSSTVFSQQSDCWKCLVAAENLEENPQALDVCKSVSGKKLQKNEKFVVNYVLGSLYVKNGEYKTALKYLEVALTSEDKLLQAFTWGLKGDCFVELNDLTKGLECYQNATKLCDHAFFTPYFLHKQGTIYTHQNNQAALDRISSELWINHQMFLLSNNYLPFYPSTSSVNDSICRATTAPLVFPSNDYGIGVFNGKKVDEQLFSSNLNYEYDIDNEQALFTGAHTLGDIIAGKAWDATLIQIWIAEHASSLSLDISEAEFQAYVMGENGYPVLPEIQQNFSDETGNLDKEAIKKFLQEKEETKNAADAKQWMEIKEQISRIMAFDKYRGLERSALYVTNLEARLIASYQNHTVNLSSVLIPYSELSDTDFKTSETEVQHYFDQHQFERDYIYRANRELNLLIVPITPSNEDSLYFIQELETLKKEFEQTKNDSLFVVQHNASEVPTSFTYLPENHPKAMRPFVYPIEMDKTFKSAEIGTVVGPYKKGNAYRLAKVTGFTTQNITARHILIGCSKYAPESERKQKLALAKQVLEMANHENFPSLVTQYSEDPGSTSSGGEYTFFPYEMVKPFADFAETERIGKIGMVETDFGFHIMEVLQRKPVKFPILAVIEKEMKPNSGQKSRIEQQLNQRVVAMKKELNGLSFQQKTDYLDSIATVMGAENQNVTVNETRPALLLEERLIADQLFSFLYSKDIAPFTFGTIISDSDRFILPVFIGAYSGKPNMYQAYSAFENDLMNAKKADVLLPKMKQYTSLEALAKAFDQSDQSATVSHMERSIPGQGYSPDFIHHLFTKEIPKGQLQFFTSDAGCFAYVVSSYKTIKVSEEDLSAIKEIALGRLMSFSSGISIERAYPFTTVYNYPLHILRLRF